MGTNAHTHTHTHTQAHTHACVHTHTHTHKHIHMHIHTNTHRELPSTTYPLISTWFSFVHVSLHPILSVPCTHIHHTTPYHTHTYTHIHLPYIHASTHLHTCYNACVRTHIYIHIHTHTYRVTERHPLRANTTFKETSKCQVGGSLLVGCLTSQQHASVSQGWICADNFTCCHTEIEVADPTFYLTQSQYTDTRLTSPSADQAPGRVATGVPIVKSLV